MIRTVVATLCTFAAAMGVAGGTTAAAAPAGCHARLTPEDARRIALTLPNPRAFAHAQHATLTTELQPTGAGGVTLVRVLATQADTEPVEVGLYTISLRTGAATDDDQEPADDAESRRDVARLLLRRCTR